MVPRWIAVFLALILCAGLLTGVRVATLTESDVIERAGRHWAETGGNVAQCIALPSDVAWIAVTCGSGEEGRLYQFDRLGRVSISPLADPDQAVKL